MTIARLYDSSEDTVTIGSLLRQAKRESSSFKYGDKKQVNDAIEKAKSTVAGLQPVLGAIRHRRNKFFAHLDARTMAGSPELNRRAALTMPELERAFDETEKIVASLERLFDGAFGEYGTWAAMIT